jgi:ribosome-binding factor A
MFQRSDRIAALIKEEIACMLLFGGLKDPRVQGSRVTEVKVSKDLSKATVFVSSDNELEHHEIVEGFINASGFIKRTLSKKLYMKKMPNLFFVYDNSVENLDKIETILRRLND